MRSLSNQAYGLNINLGIEVFCKQVIQRGYHVKFNRAKKNRLTDEFVLSYNLPTVGYCKI